MPSAIEASDHAMLEHLDDALRRHHNARWILASILGTRPTITSYRVHRAGRITVEALREQRSIALVLLPGERGGPAPVTLERAMAAMQGGPYRGGGYDEGRVDLWSAHVPAPRGFDEVAPVNVIVSGFEQRARCNQCSRTDGLCAGCGGESSSQCAMCNGVRVCSLCVGSTVLRVVPRLQVSWSVENVETFRPAGVFPPDVDEAIRVELLGRDGRREPFDLDLTGRSLADDLAIRGGSGLGSETDAWLEKLFRTANSGENERVVNRRLRVRRLDVIEVNYRTMFGGEHTVWMFGAPMQVIESDE